MSPNQETSSDQYIFISKESLVPGKRLSADLYLYLSANQTYVPFRKKGEILTEEQFLKLKNSLTTEALVLKTDVDLMKAEMKSTIQTSMFQIQAILKAGADLTGAELVKSASKILLIMDHLQPQVRESDAHPNEEVLGVLESARMMVESVLTQLGSSPSILFYDKVLTVIQSATESPLTRHQRQVSALCVLMLLTEGQATYTELLDIATAGLIHDLGLLRMPNGMADRYLNGDRQFNGMDQLQYMLHPAFSLEIVNQNKALLSDAVTKAVECHHENLDGSGFRNLHGHKIPRLARFLRIADEIALALTNAKTPLSLREALDLFSQPDTIPKYDQNILQILRQKFDST